MGKIIYPRTRFGLIFVIWISIVGAITGSARAVLVEFTFDCSDFTFKHMPPHSRDLLFWTEPDKCLRDLIQGQDVRSSPPPTPKYRWANCQTKMKATRWKCLCLMPYIYMKKSLICDLRIDARVYMGFQRFENSTATPLNPHILKYFQPNTEMSASAEEQTTNTGTLATDKPHPAAQYSTSYVPLRNTNITLSNKTISQDYGFTYVTVDDRNVTPEFSQPKLRPTTDLGGYHKPTETSVSVISSSYPRRQIPSRHDSNPSNHDGSNQELTITANNVTMPTPESVDYKMGTYASSDGLLSRLNVNYSNYTINEYIDPKKVDIVAQNTTNPKSHSKTDQYDDIYFQIKPPDRYANKVSSLLPYELNVANESLSHVSFEHDNQRNRGKENLSIATTDYPSKKEISSVVNITTDDLSSQYITPSSDIHQEENESSVPYTIAKTERPLKKITSSNVIIIADLSPQHIPPSSNIHQNQKGVDIAYTSMETFQINPNNSNVFEYDPISPSHDQPSTKSGFHTSTSHNQTELIKNSSDVDIFSKYPDNYVAPSQDSNKIEKSNNIHDFLRKFDKNSGKPNTSQLAVDVLSQETFYKSNLSLLKSFEHFNETFISRHPSLFSSKAKIYFMISLIGTTCIAMLIFLVYMIRIRRRAIYKEERVSFLPHTDSVQMYDNYTDDML